MAQHNRAAQAWTKAQPERLGQGGQEGEQQDRVKALAHNAVERKVSGANFAAKQEVDRPVQLAGHMLVVLVAQDKE